MAEVMKRYDYLWPDGRVAYQIERLKRGDGKKSFRVRRPDPDSAGEWVYGKANLKPILYNLPAVRAAVERGDWVFLPEGEKDCDTLATLGKVATTNAFGSSSWENSFAEALRGARVVILADRDTPGRKLAVVKARSLLGVAALVRAFVPPPPHSDVSDIVAAGGSLKDLVPVDLASWEEDQAPKENPKPVEDKANGTAGRHLHLVDSVTGEVIEPDACAKCGELRDQLAGAERENRAWRARYAKLARERDAAAEHHELWPMAQALFNVWRRVCKHPNSKWCPDRFWECEPRLSKYGLAACERGIAGIAYDPFTTVRKNGTIKRHDGWDLLFRSPDKFEEYANRAPLDWKPTLVESSFGVLKKAKSGAIPVASVDNQQKENVS